MRPVWISVLIAVAACKPEHTERADAAPAISVAATKPMAPEAAAPLADYLTLHDALDAGDAAIGKTVLTGVYRHRMSATEIGLVSCWDLPHDANVTHEIHASYAVPMRREVRAIRRSLVQEGYRCPLVVLRLGAVDRKTAYGETSITITATLEQVFLTVPPWSPPPMPAGVDYASFDDIDVDGAAATGKIAELPVSFAYTGDPRLFPPVDDGKFRVHGCGDEDLDDGTTLTVHFAPAQTKQAESFAECRKIRVKLQKRNGDGTSWDATLVAR